jgi:uncharacterized membrane protein YjgN (DUF898 family)/transcription elongation factor Elf1
MDEPDIVVTCPHCGFQKSVPKRSIPDRTITATCPKCGNTFPFSHTQSAEAINKEKENSDDGINARTAEAADNVASAWVGEWSDPVAARSSRRRGPQTLTFSFLGSGGEYFGIWIVNTLLKIASCGIYSAWAKVRTRRYLYGSTRLDGDQFEYTADPMALFKGWLIGAAAFILYIISQQVSLVLSQVTGIVFVIAVPWLVVRSRMFNCRNSTFRNIRFAFRPSYREAYLVYLGYPLLIMLILGLIAAVPYLIYKKTFLAHMGLLIPVLFILGLLTMPYVVYLQKRFMVENCSYGSTLFSFEAKPGDFYILSLKAFALTLGSVALFVVLVALLSGGIDLLQGVLSGKGRHMSAIMILPLMFALFFFIYFIPGIYYRTALTNLTWNKTIVAGCGFKSTLGTLNMVWLYLSNTIAIIFTLGLLVPWAQVRLIRYRLECLEIDARQEPDEFFAMAGAENPSATGEEIGDIFGIDVDFGF